MSESDSLDLDTPLDWEIAELLMATTKSFLADPVTVMPSVLRDANPEPTFIKPPPSAIEMITAAMIIVIALRRSTVIIGVSLS